MTKPNILSFYRGEVAQLGAPNPEGWARGICPFHDDSNPSLSVNVKSGGFKCFGCDSKGSLETFLIKKYPEISLADASKRASEIAGYEGRDLGGIIATYDYLDVKGEIRFQVVRFANHIFRQRQPKEGGGWVWNIKGIELIPYNLPEVVRSNQVLLVEGEKDVESLKEIGFAASTNPQGAGKWRDEYSRYFEGKDVVILPDNDAAGADHAEKVANKLNGVARSVKVVNLPDLPEKGDVSDYLADGHTKQELEALIVAAKPWDEDEFSNLITARDIMLKESPPIRWAVKGIIPEGLILCAGRPKSRKTVLFNNLSIEIERGGKAFGQIDVDQGSVVHIMFEDGERRYRDRMIRMVQDSPFPRKIYPFFDWARMGQGGLGRIERLIEATQPELRLVIIDPWARFKPIRKGRNRSIYDIDYEEVTEVKKLADKYRVAITIIHHTSKQERDDVFDTFSGTLGLSGPADGLLVLTRQGDEGILHLKGRDFDDSRYRLGWNRDTLTWSLLGRDEEIKSTRKKQAVYDAIKQANQPISPSEIAKGTGFTAEYVRKTLPILIAEGNIERVNRGQYIYTNGNYGYEGYEVHNESTHRTHSTEGGLESSGETEFFEGVDLDRILPSGNSDGGYTRDEVKGLIRRALLYRKL